MIAIDTNILVYSIDRHDPVKRSKARTILRQLRSQANDVLLPWQVLGEFMRFLRSMQDRGELSSGDVERVLRGYLRLSPVALPTLRVMEHALFLTRRYSLSHWDGMLLGACLDADVDTLYTEDMGAPVVINGIALINPFS
jgi:predicted nucleic acid-binding protein